MSLVRFKHGDYAEALQLGDACLALESASAIAPADHILLIHRVATSAENMERYDVALSRYRTVLDFDASAKGSLLTDAQRLGVRENIGFVLHEDKQYAQAVASNRATLTEAERIFGPGDGRLTTILTNLAQNEYELGQFAEAEDVAAKPGDRARHRQARGGGGDAVPARSARIRARRHRGRA